MAGIFPFFGILYPSACFGASSTCPMQKQVRNGYTQTWLGSEAHTRRFLAVRLVVTPPFLFSLALWSLVLLVLLGRDRGLVVTEVCLRPCCSL